MRPEHRYLAREIEAALPRRPLSGWYRLDPIVLVDGRLALAFERARDHLRVLVSIEPLRIGIRWLHASASFVDRIPSWDDMCDVKERFIGHDRMAVQMHPPRLEYVNVHPNVLHLWCNLDGDTVLDEHAHQELAVPL